MGDEVIQIDSEQQKSLEEGLITDVFPKYLPTDFYSMMEESLNLEEIELFRLDWRLHNPSNLQERAPIFPDAVKSLANAENISCLVEYPDSFNMGRFDLFDRNLLGNNGVPIRLEAYSDVDSKIITSNYRDALWPVAFYYKMPWVTAVGEFADELNPLERVSFRFTMEHMMYSFYDIPPILKTLDRHITLNQAQKNDVKRQLEIEKKYPRNYSTLEILSLIERVGLATASELIRERYSRVRDLFGFREFSSLHCALSTFVGGNFVYRIPTLIYTYNDHLPELNVVGSTKTADFESLENNKEQYKIKAIPLFIHRDER